MPDDNRRIRRIENAADWERVLAAAAHLQRIVPDAILVGGSAAAMYLEHRFSNDDDHVVAGLMPRFEAILADLESVANWNTSRTNFPVLILGQLDGIDTGVRNLIRSAPLETNVIETAYGSITLPTLDEMLRIKAWLAVTRNATRDYIDAAALTSKVFDEGGQARVTTAILAMDALYPQKTGTAVSLQVARQFAEPKPFDFDKGKGLNQYRIRADRWRDWSSVYLQLQHTGSVLLKEYALRNKLG